MFIEVEIVLVLVQDKGVNVVVSSVSRWIAAHIGSHVEGHVSPTEKAPCDQQEFVQLIRNAHKRKIVLQVVLGDHELVSLRQASVFMPDEYSSLKIVMGRVGLHELFQGSIFHQMPLGVILALHEVVVDRAYTRNRVPNDGYVT